MINNTRIVTEHTKSDITILIGLTWSNSTVTP